MSQMWKTAKHKCKIHKQYKCIFNINFIYCKLKVYQTYWNVFNCRIRPYTFSWNKVKYTVVMCTLHHYHRKLLLCKIAKRKLEAKTVYNTSQNLTPLCWRHHEYKTWVTNTDCWPWHNFIITVYSWCARNRPRYLLRDWLAFQGAFQYSIDTSDCIQKLLWLKLENE